MSVAAISLVPAITMEDDLGIVYLIETAQQFWSELEDILRLPSEPPTLYFLDTTLKRFITLCATYHEQYLQSPLQLEHAFDLILHSDLFQFHSERMTEIVVDDLQRTTDPHVQFVSYHILLTYGQRRTELFRSHKRWQPLLPLLMDHVLVEIDPDIEDTYFGLGAGGSAGVGVPVPIEAKLRSLGVKILYEVCRVQKLSATDLRIFDDAFIDYLFDLVEQTRYMQDDTFNYSVIKLIVALNEQFMVASLGADSSQLNSSASSERNGESKNRVIRVLMRRLGLSKTFGENMIFMLNRAKRTPEDLCMQLLILKILYVLFTTKGTEEYFYTNDLRVLVDVFLRELSDLDEDSEALKHTYLRVLHPLLTKTQLRNIPYKRPQILYALESLIGNAKIREVNHTTKRLVDRCLGGEWCVQLRASTPPPSTGMGMSDMINGVGRLSVGGDKESDTASDVSTPTAAVFSPSSQAQLERSGSMKRSGIGSKSVENLRLRETKPKDDTGGGTPRSPLDKLRRQSNASTHSLPTVPPSGITSPTSPTRRSTVDATSPSHHHHQHQHHAYPISPSHSNLSYGSRSPTSPISPTSVASAPSQPPITKRRPPPPAPPKRRKPPAIPVTVMTTVKSSEPSPLGRGAFEGR